MSRLEAHGRMVGDIVSAAHLTTLEQIPDLVTEHAARAGWPEVLIYLADLQQESLYLLSGQETDAKGRAGGSDDRPAALRVEGTLAGRAFQTGHVLAATPASSGQWWVPLLDGTERLGVLRVRAGTDAHPEDAQDLRKLAGLIALLMVSKRGTSDSYATLVRRRRMGVAAEMEWRLTPPRTFATDRALISAVMEPAYEVSGDVFDYGIAGEKVNLCVFDAMGHDIAAGLTANLAVAACRNHRRQNGGLLETAEAVDQVLTAEFHGSRYATGIIATLDLATGSLSWVNRGHHPPVVIRGGRTVVTLACPPAPPMGTGIDAGATLCHDQLEPGDRLVLYTDGITEARSPGGEEFGLTRFTDFLIRHHHDGLPVPETLRRLIRSHLDYHHGQLDDDATVLLVEWNGPTPYPVADVEALAGLPPGSAPADALTPAWGARDDQEES
ncbi:PP2C family protein-serine/threonine phosphatase [Streptomyces sp. NPDC047108]|uniref:PP2C family protein-serine/threonine phosphatase n=1 Tax=Streptomyces sp. NPDC047108 TaxID=3155025 RepID=UPI0033E2AB55